MANYAYLCVSDIESIYPGFADSAYDPAVNTVAACAKNVPLLWFALFRPESLVTRTFDTDDGPYVVTAPIALRKQALTNLDASLSRLETLFHDRGSLTEHARLLADALRGVAGRYATIEWDEIDVITEGGFLAEARAAMASLDPSAPPRPLVDRERLLRLSGIGRRERAFPPAAYLINHHAPSAEDEFLHTRLLGSRHLKAVPWGRDLVV